MDESSQEPMMGRRNDDDGKMEGIFSIIPKAEALIEKGNALLAALNPQQITDLMTALNKAIVVDPVNGAVTVNITLRLKKPG